jgi:hypothetical protein
VLFRGSFDDLVRAAHDIVHARVASATPRWVDGRRVETIVMLEAVEYLKGGPESRLAIRIPGGEIGRYRTLFPGAPRLRADEEVVLFLRLDGPGLPRLLGLGQGVLRVTTGAAGERQVVTREGPTLANRRTPTLTLESMRAFRERVRRILAPALAPAGRP